MIALVLLAQAAGHIYLAQGKLLFLLPAPESACSITSLRYGPSNGKWERGTNPPEGNCAFRQSVEPGGLLPAWGDPGKDTEELEVAYQVKGDKKLLSAKLTPEKLETDGAAKLSAKISKVKSAAKVAVKNEGAAAVLVGDAVASRNKPTDDCVGNGATTALQPGESLVDVRPGLVSKSMQGWVAVFTGEKQCKWVEARH
jgi:hypothetical protein